MSAARTVPRHFEQGHRAGDIHVEDSLWIIGFKHEPGDAPGVKDTVARRQLAHYC